MISEIFSVESFVWTCLWQSIVLIAVGLSASFLLRRRSSRAHQVLLLSIVAAVIVPAISALVKHYKLGMFVAEPVVMQSQLEDQAIANTHSPLGPIAQDFAYEPGPIEAGPPPVTAGSQSAPLPWARIALYGWIAASLILAIRLLVTFMSGVCLLGRAQPLDCEKMEKAVRSARTRLGVDKNVEVCSSRGVRSPVIWCWRRTPVLLVPSAAGRADSEFDWTGVLCHELAHWKRRDHISGLLAEMAVCILPWNLLLWWAKSRLTSLSEQACDDWVLATGQPGADYAESLLDLTPGGQMAFVPAVVSSERGLAGRIRRILKDSCGNPRTGAAWALVVSVITICVALGVAFAQTRPAETEESNDRSSFNERFELSKDITVELEAGPDGMRKIFHARSVRFDKADSNIRVTLRADVRRGLPFEWKTRIELLGDGDEVLGWRDSLNKAQSLVSGQPVIEELQIEFAPFKWNEVADAQRFRIGFEQIGTLLDEIGRPYDGTRTDWIQGQVTGPDGLPVIDAIVIINEHKEEGGPFRVPRVGADEDGYYKFGAVDWPYRLGAERRQRLSSTDVECYQLILLKQIFDGAQTVDFKFDEPPRGTASLVGQVVDGEGVPIRQFKANIMEYGGSDEVDSENSDGSYLESTWYNQEVDSEDGVFRLENVPAGKYRIRIIPREKQYEWYHREVVLADSKATNLVLKVPSKHVLYGRVLFKDGSAAVLKPAPWAGAETRVLLPLGGRARRVATVEEDGYFAAYFDEESLEQLKSARSPLIIDVPIAGQGRRATVGEFPFELLAPEKNKAGVIKVNRPARPDVESAAIEPNESTEPNEPTVSVNFKDVEFKTIITKLAAWTGKTIIPAAEAMKQKVTIYAPKKLPKNAAVAVILNALRAKGYVVEETEYAIVILGMPNEGLGKGYTESDESEVKEVDKNRVVQRSYWLKNCSPAKMSQIIKPMLSDFGHQSSDEETSMLLIIDTVENLKRIEKIIAYLDVPKAEQYVIDAFRIYNGEPSDIVQKLVHLLTGRLDEQIASADPTSTSVAVGPSGHPVSLTPDLTGKRIIVTASAEDMKKIAEWIEKLDNEEDRIPREYETVQLGYADVSEVVERLNEAVQKLPGIELQQNVLIQPLVNAKQIMIFGRQDLREKVKELIAEIDVPRPRAGRFFRLKYADPNKVKEDIEALYGRQAGRVQAMSHPNTQQVLVVASPENMLKIADKIAEWDVPLDLEQIKPRIFTLRNSDPIRMAKLLTTLFAGEDGDRENIYEVLFGKAGEEERKTVGLVGRQLTFEAVPGTKKIIVISNFGEAYDVVGKLIFELDRQEIVTQDIEQIDELIAKLVSEVSLRGSNVSGAGVTGLVKDPQGRPVSGTRVTLFQAKLEYVTDAEGKFTASLPSSDKMRYFFAVDKLRELVGVGRLAGEKQQVEINLVPARIVSGRVVDPNGRPVSGAQIAPLPMTCFHVLTDSKGRFDVGWSSEWAGNIKDFCLMARHVELNLAALVDVTPETQTVDIKLEPALALSGTVEDGNGRSIPGAAVGLSLIRGWGAGTPVRDAITDDEGRFELPALPQRQEYGVRANAEGYQRNAIKTGVINRLTQVEEVGPIILKKPILSASGIVIDDSGKPVADIPVYWRGDGQPALASKTDAQGRFKFDGVCAGPVVINAKNETLFGSVETQGGEQDVRVVVGPRFEPRPNAPSGETPQSHE